MGEPNRPDASRYWRIRTVLELIKTGVWIAWQWWRNADQ